ncbi:MAG: DUF1376 domain-containing protein [Acidobacteria bacterium]|nr:DUF1376 domain-containing protein [Acidobacteriota bacterium]
MHTADQKRAQRYRLGGGVNKQPFLPLFFGDFLASTAEWSGEEASLYLTLLGHQWTLGTLPADPAKLARLVRWDRKAFEKCWPQVSSKFAEQGGRLVNERLEQHRAKSEELAQKNKASGRKGAEARWRNDGVRHSPAIANAIEPLCHPSHPIPSEGVLPTSPLTPNVSASPARARPVTRGEGGEVPRETIAAIRAAYPPGLYREADWLLAEREVLRRVGEGVTPAALLTAAADYGAQQSALEKAGTQYVLKPSRFFGTDEWRGPFPMPAKAETAMDRLRRMTDQPTDSRVIEHEPEFGRFIANG